MAYGVDAFAWKVDGFMKPLGGLLKYKSRKNWSANNEARAALFDGSPGPMQHPFMRRRFKRRRALLIDRFQAWFAFGNDPEFDVYT